jgi:hypothetical protein
MTQFYTEMPGLAVSDRITGAVTLLNCGPGDHHILGFITSTHGGFHHGSYEVPSLDAITLSAIRMRDAGWAKGRGPSCCAATSPRPRPSPACSPPPRPSSPRWISSTPGYRDYRFTLPDVIADNASPGRVVLAPRPADPLTWSTCGWPAARCERGDRGGHRGVGDGHEAPGSRGGLAGQLPRPTRERLAYGPAFPERPAQ